MKFNKMGLKQDFANFANRLYHSYMDQVEHHHQAPHYTVFFNNEELSRAAKNATLHSIRIENLDAKRWTKE